MELLAWYARALVSRGADFEKPAAECNRLHSIASPTCHVVQVTFQGDASLSGGGMQVERVKALNSRM